MLKDKRIENPMKGLIALSLMALNSFFALGKQGGNKGAGGLSREHSCIGWDLFFDLSFSKGLLWYSIYHFARVLL
jgi:hypothetical protein